MLTRRRSNYYLHLCRYTSFHGIIKSLTVCPDPGNTRKRDSIVYLHDGRLAEVIEGEGPWRALPVKVKPYTTNIGFTLPYGDVGLYIYDGLDYAGEFILHREAIKGKAMICGTVISHWLQPWFMSKVDQ